VEAKKERADGGYGHKIEEIGSEVSQPRSGIHCVRIAVGRSLDFSDSNVSFAYRAVALDGRHGERIKARLGGLGSEWVEELSC
jgi:hypothetical protein